MNSKYTKKLWGVLYKDQIILLFGWWWIGLIIISLHGWWKWVLIIMHSECIKEWKVGYIAIWSAGLSFWLRGRRCFACLALWLTVHKSACKLSCWFCIPRGTIAFDGAHNNWHLSHLISSCHMVMRRTLTSFQKSFVKVLPCKQSLRKNFDPYQSKAMNCHASK